MEKKKRYNSETKTIIVREYLENKVPISELSEKYGIHPNAIYKWKKEIFETASEKLSKSGKVSERQDELSARRISELEALLSKRESLIAELVEENIELKKKSIGDVLTKNGLSRRFAKK